MRSVSEYWSSAARRAEPYVPGDQPGGKVIKLNTNENPYPPSPKVLSALREAVGPDLRLYPDPTAAKVRSTAAKLYGLSPEEVFVGNGSDEVLAFAFQAFFHQDKPIRFPDITYSFYPVYARLYQIPVEVVPVTEGFAIRAADYYRSPGGVIFPNPNAPTGLLLGLEEVASIARENHGQVVVVDEAYIDFGGESAAPLVRQYPNLLVIQTLSKSRSLAGLRIGLAFGSAELIEGLNRIKGSFNSYTMDRLALTAAEAALEDSEYYSEICQKVIQTRTALLNRLEELGFRGTSSKANFVFAAHSRIPAKEIYEKLKERGIYVRYFPAPRINNYLRISIGTPTEMDALTAALADIVQHPHA
ncbi:MAG: histidinol-phosphate transaminase [Limnochordia bacterium]|jgi:histidinol-phosphate aminotransferase